MLIASCAALADQFCQREAGSRTDHGTWSRLGRQVTKLVRAVPDPKSELDFE
jgi:hypothetical protein